MTEDMIEHLLKKLRLSGQYFNMYLLLQMFFLYDWIWTCSNNYIYNFFVLFLRKRNYLHNCSLLALSLISLICSFIKPSIFL